MTREEMKFQVAVSCIQGIIEAKLGIIGEVVPSVAVTESLRIADEFVKHWFSETKEQQPAKRSDSVAKEMFIKALERAVEQTKKGYELTDCDKHSWWEDFKAYSEIKPAEWSEEDERNLP